MLDAWLHHAECRARDHPAQRLHRARQQRMDFDRGARTIKQDIDLF
jgi:hypothetical protein